MIEVAFLILDSRRVSFIRGTVSIVRHVSGSLVRGRVHCSLLDSGRISIRLSLSRDVSDDVRVSDIGTVRVGHSSPIKLQNSGTLVKETIPGLRTDPPKQGTMPAEEVIFLLSQGTILQTPDQVVV